MRAFQVLNALAYRYEISLLTLEAPHPAKMNDAQKLVRAACRSVTTLPNRRWHASVLWRKCVRRLSVEAYYACWGRPSDWQFVSAADRRTLTTAYADKCYDLIHMHRLYMLPVLSSLPANLARVPVQIDIDDVESSTRERLAALAGANGYSRLARMMSRDATFYRSMETTDIARFERAFVCAAGDALRLDGGHDRLRTHVIPNVVAIPERRSGSEDHSTGPFVFLFVGSIDYYPNLDAIAFFCREVVPVLRSRSKTGFAVRVLASGRKRHWARVPKIPELVRCEDSNHALAAEYSKADAVVVPIRAGGGTRIKTLEAFAHGKPVVATSIGVEGLHVRAGEHALIAETADEFAVHCLRLMDDSTLRRKLAERAFEFVSMFYGPDALRRRLDRVEGLANEDPAKTPA